MKRQELPPDWKCNQRRVCLYLADSAIKALDRAKCVNGVSKGKIVMDALRSAGVWKPTN